jgi:hypothetical protein
MLGAVWRQSVRMSEAIAPAGDRRHQRTDGHSPLIFSASRYGRQQAQYD